MPTYFSKALQVYMYFLIFFQAIDTFNFFKLVGLRKSVLNLMAAKASALKR